MVEEIFNFMRVENERLYFLLFCINFCLLVKDWYLLIIENLWSFVCFMRKVDFEFLKGWFKLRSF